MDRTLKFRAWDKEDKHMNYGWEHEYGDCHLEYAHILPVPDDSDFYLIYESNTEGVSEGTEMRVGEVMQYTGLKDKNGQEIYEGDILELDCSSNYPIKAVVEWVDDCRPCFKASLIHEMVNVDHKEGKVSTIEIHSWCGSHCCFWKSNVGEVIGNVFENPELLDQ